MFFRTALTLAAGLAFAASANAYDATADFSTTANPNGAWLYGYSTGDVSHHDFTLFDKQSGMGWASSGHLASDAPVIWKNTSAATLFGISTGQLSLHPVHDTHSWAILRFVAPAAGDYQVDMGLPNGIWNSNLFLNDGSADPLAYFASGSDASSFSGRVSLAQGGHLDIAVVASWSNVHAPPFNTPVTFTVNALPVPEPTQGLMLGAGLLALAAMSARRRRAD